MSSVSQNLIAIHDTIDKAATKWQRNSKDVQLIAVSKQQPDDRIEVALNAGHRCFGENRVQEAIERWGERRTAHTDLDLHLIGPLQTNKAAQAVGLFDCIHTVDREKLARILAKEMGKQSRSLPCFIQVNTGGEDQKAGIDPAELPDFLAFCREECALDIIGLMAIPPIDEPAALHFALLKKLAVRHGLPNLSMGMSSDFEKAIALGATHIRVGTGVFGAR